MTEYKKGFEEGKKESGAQIERLFNLVCKVGESNRTYEQLLELKDTQIELMDEQIGLLNKIVDSLENILKRVEK